MLGVLSCDYSGSRGVVDSLTAFLAQTRPDVVLVFAGLLLIVQSALTQKPSSFDALYQSIIIVPLIGGIIFPFGPYFPYICSDARSQLFGSDLAGTGGAIVGYFTSRPLIFANVVLLVLHWRKTGEHDPSYYAKRCFFLAIFCGLNRALMAVLSLS